jgi:hypothetical protein
MKRMIKDMRLHNPEWNKHCECRTTIVNNKLGIMYKEL